MLSRFGICVKALSGRTMAVKRDQIEGRCSRGEIGRGLKIFGTTGSGQHSISYIGVRKRGKIRVSQSNL